MTYHGNPLSVAAVSMSGEVYVRIAGRRDRTSTASEVLNDDREGGAKSAGEDTGLIGERRERSIMKFPAWRLIGERGRWRKRVMSYGWREVRDEEREVEP